MLSALFAENWWLATRALAITASGLTVFWVARALAAAGYERALITGLAAAIVIGAMTALLQAYGIEPEYMSLSRAPGGTFGNRNFMAHLSAIGTPIILLCADRGATRVGVRARHAGHGVSSRRRSCCRGRARRGSRSWWVARSWSCSAGACVTPGPIRCDVAGSRCWAGRRLLR